ncbi:hypothetical protein EMMF5_000316 [Cystobasidiomycetes sp. EMM_F5]
MRIAVTGSSGNVGAATVHYILEHGGEAVSILGLDITAPTQILPDSLKPRFEFKRLDSTVYDDVHQAFRGCDAIIHCAALPTVGKFPAPLIHNTNVVSSYNALHAAASLGITRVVQLSSINAIGACYTPYLLDFHYLPLDESHPFIGADPYALSKQVCELQADQIARAFPNTRIASIRPHACLEQPPQINVNDVFGWVLMTEVARACWLGIVSEGWAGAEAFYIVAPTNNVYEKLGPDAPGSGYYIRIPIEKGHAQSLHRLVLALNGRDEVLKLYKENWDASHLCHQPTCLNPQHIIAESHEDNLSRRECAGKTVYVGESRGQVWEIQPEACKHTPACIYKVQAVNGVRELDKESIEDFNLLLNWQCRKEVHEKAVLDFDKANKARENKRPAKKAKTE